MKGNSYPFTIPKVEIASGLDFLVLQLPSRYQPMMPNGLGYVYEILKRCRIQFRMIDLNIILYHRYHSRRTIEGSPIITPSGYIMKDDPWDNTNTGEWEKDEVIEFFWPQIEDVLLKITTNPPKAIGLSIHANNRTLSNRFIKELRVRMPELPIVVGGYDCFYSYLGPILIPDSDYWVIGESELTLEPLVMALARDERPKDLPGIISRYDSPMRKFLEPLLPIDLDSIGFPKYDWADLSLYRTYKGDHLVPITASRGCNWGRCRFCSEILPFRKRSPQNVVEEIEYFVSNGFHIFHFNESDVNGDPKNLYDICSGVIKRGLKVKLVGQLRISKHNSPEYFRHLARAGFVHLRFGVDGWSENTLKLQRKGYNIRMIFQNLRDCHDAGIWTTVNMVIGVPGETEEDISESIDNIARCKKYIDLVESLNILILGAGSEYYRNPDLYKIRFRGDKDEIYRNHPYYIPSELWYSEDPFIDHEVRVKRLDRICAGLYKHGVNIGGFTQGAVRYLLEGDAGSYEGVHFGKVKKVKNEECSHPEIFGGKITFGEIALEENIKGEIDSMPNQLFSKFWALINRKKHYIEQKLFCKQVQVDIRKDQIPTEEQKICLRVLAESVAHSDCKFLEVGSWCGDSAIILGAVAKKYNGTLFCVDWWKGNIGTELAEIASKMDVFSFFWRRICSAGLEDVVVPIRGRSDIIAKILKEHEFDLIFIDSDHRFENVLKDIQEYAPLVRDKGILCGHDCEGYISDFDITFLEAGKDVDFYENVHCGVVLAVGSIFKDYSINWAIWSVMATNQGRDWEPTNLVIPELEHKSSIPFLFEEGYKGFNIISYGGKLYGLAQDEGAFDIGKVNRKEYRRIFIGETASEIKNVINGQDKTSLRWKLFRARK